MGNLMSQRINSSSSSSSSSGLGFYFPYSSNEYLTRYFNQKSIFGVRKQSQPAGLTIILHDTFSIKSNSDYIVFPQTLIALEILYTAPGELWNWNHPKPRDFPPAIHTISARDSIMNISSIPDPEDITRSEEYTCVISTKDGYPKMTHLYGDIVVDCHPMPRSMAVSTTTLSHDNHRRVYHGESSNNGYLSDDEVIKHCYICRKSYKQLSDISMHMDEDFCNKERDIKGKKGNKGNQGKKRL